MLTAVTAALASNPEPNLPGFLNVVGTYLGHYGYWAILLLVMVEDFGIPVPGETILIAAAIYAGAGRLNVVAVGLVGFVAAVIGDNIGFAIGHFGGRALALRWGKYIFLTEERLDKAEVFFARHGGKIIVVARFIEGLRQANGIIAGIAGMRWLRFLAFNALGAALWVGTWVSLGYLAGNHITADLPRHHAILVLRAHRGRRAAGGVHRLAPAASSEGRPRQGRHASPRPTPPSGRRPPRADAAHAADDTDRPLTTPTRPTTPRPLTTPTPPTAPRRPTTGTIRAADSEVHESS